MRTRTCSGQDPGPPLRGTARTDAPRPGRIPPTPLPVPPSDATALAFCTPRPPAKPGPSPGGVPGGEQHHCPGPVRAVKSLDSDCPRDPLRPDCPGPLTVPGSRGARPACGLRGSEAPARARAAARMPSAPVGQLGPHPRTPGTPLGGGASLVGRRPALRLRLEAEDSDPAATGFGPKKISGRRGRAPDAQGGGPGGKAAAGGRGVGALAGSRARRLGLRARRATRHGVGAMTGSSRLSPARSRR